MINRQIALAVVAAFFLNACGTGTKSELQKEETPTEITEQPREEKPMDALEEVLALKQQVQNSDYRTIDTLISQIRISLSKDTTNNVGNEEWIFPQLDREKLVDLLKSMNPETLKKHRSFQKDYSFNSAPKGYKADSDECPDILQISINNDSKSKFTIMLNNSFVVEEIDCAESAVIYTFEVLESGILLKKTDYAG